MLIEQQAERYSRHIMLDEVGAEGQLKLLRSKVFLVGVGGFGAPVALYLTAAGVGTIGIADDDSVELSDLQRQVLFKTNDLGKPKVVAAWERMRALNPEVTVITHQVRMTASNILRAIRDYDFILDGTDNFAAKYLINDACILAGKPFSHAGVLRFDGQTMTVIPKKTACFRCLFPDQPPRDVTPPSSRAGIFGVLPGLIGIIQATEAIKSLLGRGKLLTDRLLTYDALNLRFREIPVKRNPDCKACGESPSITELRDETTG